MIVSEPILCSNVLDLACDTSMKPVPSLFATEDYVELWSSRAKRGEGGNMGKQSGTDPGQGLKRGRLEQRMQRSTK